MAHTDLTLPEEVLLLVLTDRDGALLDSTRFRYAIAGAVLAEMLIQGRVELEPGSVDPLVTVTEREASGDPVLDDALGQLLTATRRTKPKRWVGRFAEDEELYLRVARQLCRKEALDEHEGRVRLIFRRTVYADLDPAAEEAVVERVRDAIMEDGPVDVRTAALVSLARAGEILSHLVDPADLLARHDRLLAMTDDEEIRKEAERDEVWPGVVRMINATKAAVLESSAPVSG